MANAPTPHDEIQPRFWRLLEAAFPSKDRLIASLDALPRQELVAFVIHVEAARWEVREEWEGPFIHDNVGHLSEDGTQNLTDWIVSQGEAFWRGACGASDEVLRDLFFEREDAVDRGDRGLGGSWLEDRRRPLAPGEVCSVTRKYRWVMMAVGGGSLGSATVTPFTVLSIDR